MGSSKSVTREIANDEPVLLRSKENIKDLINIRWGISQWKSFHAKTIYFKLCKNLVPLETELYHELRNCTIRTTVSAQMTVSYIIFFREVFNFDGVQNMSKVVCNWRLLDEKGIQGEPTLLRSDENAGWDFYIFFLLLLFVYCILGIFVKKKLIEKQIW